VGGKGAHGRGQGVADGLGRAVGGQVDQQNVAGGALDQGADLGCLVPVDDIRDDMPPTELATYCLHVLTAASSLPSDDAARRLVAVTLAGLRPA
jgi:hypothetical protein